MEIQGYFTKKGLALSTKLNTGAALTITRVVGGSGQTLLTAETQDKPCQTLAVNTPDRKDNTAILPATLTAALAEAAYTLTELGVYARDPDEGEILYKLYRLTAPVEISPGSRLVLRFYLEETVSQDMDVTVDCSPAGLVTEQVFSPVRDKVLALAAKSKTVTLDASKLQAYLDALPRLLTEDLTIKVSGNLDAPLQITGFYGIGSLAIQAASSGFVVNGGIITTGCSVMLYFKGLTFTSEGSVGTCFESVRCTYVILEGCSFTGNGENTAVAAYHSGTVYSYGCTVSDFHEAVEVNRGGTVIVAAKSANEFQNNTIGAYTMYGSMILLCGSAPDTLGGASNVHGGGLIVKANGTLI